MLTIEWQKRAQTNLEKILTYIATDNKKAATDLLQTINDTLIVTASYPYMYKKSQRLKGCREVIPHPNYIIFYQITSHAIVIKNIVHARRKFP
ncbi:type II toxin-antitoxin system RelE/ParE family toxin [Orbaceae bacterium ac157xtp]